MQKIQGAGRRFERYFQSFWQKTEETPRLFSHIHTACIPSFQEALSTFHQSNIRLLDLGGGDGSLMLALMAAAEGTFFHVTANDTSHLVLDRYQARVPGFVDCIPTRLEQAHLHIDIPLDIILASHSLYGTDVSDVLADVRKRLAQDGQLWIVLDADDSRFVDWRKTYWQEVHGVAWDETSCYDIEQACENLALDCVKQEVEMYLDSSWLAKEACISTSILRSENLPPSITEAIRNEMHTENTCVQKMTFFQISGENTTE